MFLPRIAQLMEFQFPERKYDSSKSTRAQNSLTERGKKWKITPVFLVHLRTWKYRYYKEINYIITLDYSIRVETLSFLE